MFIKFKLLISKKLKFGYVPSSGRNFTGKICVYHKGGGNKKCHLLVDFIRRINSYGFIFKIIKHSLFSSLVGLIVYENGLSSYILLSETNKLYNKLFSGTTWLSNKNNLLKAGFAVPILNIGLFSLVNNIELYPFKGSQLIRAAGNNAIVTAKLNSKILLKLRSGWNILISQYVLCSLGSVSNSLFKFYNFKKAGILRSLGKRPTVRGVAMNPCDHPHGGGEGKKSPLVSAKSPWGWLTKGVSTKKTKLNIIKKKKYKNIR